MIESLWLPACACLLLTGIHVYLGLHVLQRRVIFVDLALAQMIALGAIIGECLGHEIGVHDPWSMAFSLGAGLVGAALFACLDPTSRRVPVEASIGVVYVVAMAATMLLSMNLPHGLEHAHALLSGSILWVTPKDLLVAAVLYGAVAILHLVFRRRFLQLSFARAEARAAGIAVRWWDFLFYAGFAVVVSSSVAMAGVLLVFAYLVIPAAFAVLFAESVAVRLVLGWCMGAAVSILGLVASYHWDLPSGPCLVLALAVALALATMRSGRGSWAPGNRRKP